MSAIDDLPLLALGAGGALATVALLRRAFNDDEGDELLPIDPAAWVFPLPDLGDRRPEISDGFSARATHEQRQHRGADIMFRRRHRGDLADVYRPGTRHGTPGYFMPDGVPVLAVGAGLVTFARWTVRGYTVTIRHPEGVTTYYTHMASLAVALGQSVDAGTPIGTVGGDPKDPRHLMHLHIELWRSHKRAGAIDPAPYLLAWSRRAIAWSAPTAPRNAALRYRSVGAAGRYPEWMQALRGKSGVYVIRERGTDGKPVVAYVGQSSSGRLYETLTRHFQTWRRRKRWWSGQFGTGHDPGLTYARGRVEVAARVTPASDAWDEETRAIRRLRPRDNIVKQPDELEPVPF